MHHSDNSLPVILTGDRTTGPLHLGHYAGSLRNRVDLQHTHRQFVLLADLQAMTDNADDPERVSRNVLEVTADYLAVGIDPEQTVICVQSLLPALAELTFLYMNYVTVARLERNPTIKDEIQSRGFGRDIPAGFMCYPVSQAADITAFKATVVPVGDDQAPLIEQTNEIVRRLNRLTGKAILPEASALMSGVSRLPGIDGKAKMSKSLGNAIPLSATPEEISAAVRGMFTDPNHIRVSDPGKVEGNVVFTYLDAFDPDIEGVEDLKDQYRKGGLADIVVKNRLDRVLQELLRPIRQRRREVRNDRHYLKEVLYVGTENARKVTQSTLDELREAMGMFNIASLELA